jgi:hypothetical protein
MTRDDSSLAIGCELFQCSLQQFMPARRLGLALWQSSPLRSAHTAQLVLI